jgi:hypothetical protein
MLYSILSLRWITLVAALGAALGAMLMFFEGCLKLAYALEMIVHPSADTETSVIATVMQATDAFLFGLVLIVFAYAITFGFAFVWCLIFKFSTLSIAAGSGAPSSCDTVVFSGLERRDHYG